MAECFPPPAAGNDTLIGGAGTDRLTGGAGLDTFRFLLPSDSVRGGRHDSILDFIRAQHDNIDLRAIDANTRHAGNDAFQSSAPRPSTASPASCAPPATSSRATSTATSSPTSKSM